MKVAIYARVSTDEQAKNGYGLLAQIHQCRMKADTSDIIEYVDEGISGQFLDRPAMNQLRLDLKNGLIEKVICLAPDRLARNATNASIILKEILLRSKIEFVNTNFENNAIGMFNFQILSAVAELEKATINERMSRGRREKARQNKIVKDYKIYGYEYDRKSSQFLIKDNEAEIVRFIFASFANGMSINRIAIQLNEWHLPTKRGANVWHRETIRQMLGQSAYRGVFYQNRWNTEGMLANKYLDKHDKVPIRIRDQSEWIAVSCPSIIDHNQWDYVQKLLECVRRRFAKSSKHNYLLSGIIRCGDCGNTMTGRKSRNWGKDVLTYTDIKNTQGTKFRGCGCYVKAGEIEDLVWESIWLWLTSQAAIEVISASTENTPTFEQSQLSIIRHRLLEIQKERKAQVTLYLKSQELGITDDVEEKLRELKHAEEELCNMMAAYKPSEDESFVKKEIDLPIQKNLDEMNHDHVLNFMDRQWILRKIVQEIFLSKNGQVVILTY